MAAGGVREPPLPLNHRSHAILINKMTDIIVQEAGRARAWAGLLNW